VSDRALEADVRSADAAPRGRVFLAWARRCTRSAWQAHNVGAELISVHPAVAVPSAPLRLLVRYAVSAVATWRALRRARPSAVFAANMPVFLPLVAWAYAASARVPFVLDCHSGAFNNPRWRWAAPLNRFVTSRATVSITTNAEHRALVERWGGTALVMSDVPVAPEARACPLELRRPAIVAVCSYAFDEPIEAILAAAARCPEIAFYLTGDAAKLRRRARTAPPANAVATGFLRESDYYALLAAADGVLVLTTRDCTMQRGAYEALYVGTPIVTSGWPLLREVFADAALYVDNTPDGIAAAVRELVRDAAERRRLTAARAIVRRRVYAAALGELNRRLSAAASPLTPSR